MGTAVVDAFAGIVEALGNNVTTHSSWRETEQAILPIYFLAVSGHVLIPTKQ